MNAHLCLSASFLGLPRQGQVFAALALLQGLASVSRAQRLHCGLVQLPATATCVETADGITLSLLGNSRIGWRSVVVPAGQVVRIQSVDGKGYASHHIASSRAPSQIFGRVEADGPLSLTARGGIAVMPGGSVSAPSVFMTTHTAGDENAVLEERSTPFTENASSSGVIVDGEVLASTGNAVILSHNVVTGDAGRISSPTRVQIAGGYSAIAGTRSALSVAAVPGGFGTVLNRGKVESPQVSILSQGFIKNSGAIVGMGSSGRVVVEAPEIIHEDRPGSLISAQTVVVKGNLTGRGRIISGTDGTNPGGVNVSRQIPSLTQNRLSTNSVTRLDATRLNVNQLSQSALPSLGTKTAKTPTSALRQGQKPVLEAEEEKKRQASANKTAATVAGNNATRGTLRRGFFGQISAVNR